MEKLRTLWNEGIFSSASLHVLAMACMLSDHLWATIVPGAEWMTCVGRLAFPIFAFMIVEGYFHTHNFKKYCLRMLAFAVISEVPFDLVYGSTWFYPYHQNVMWTFLMALLLIRLLEWVRERAKLPVYILACVGVSIVGLLLGYLTMVDYYGAGVLTVLMFYFCRQRNLLTFVLQAAFLWFVLPYLVGGYYYEITLFGQMFEIQQQALGAFALIPIWLYRGRQGYHATWFKYFNYAFYPGHLLILYVLWSLV